LITGACLHNGDLVISGPFTIVGGVPANGIARWDGTAWHAMGFGLGGANGDFGYARRFAPAGSDLYVAGYFAFADGLSANNIAKWDGSAWSTLGDGIERVIYDFGPGAEVLALHVDGNELLVGGVFNKAGGQGAANFARYCLGGAATCPADRDGN